MSPIRERLLKAAHEARIYLDHLGWKSVCQRRSLKLIDGMITKIHFTEFKLENKMVNNVVMDCMIIRTYMRDLPFSQHNRIVMHRRLKDIETPCINHLQLSLPAFKSRRKKKGRR